MSFKVLDRIGKGSTLLFRRGSKPSAPNRIDLSKHVEKGTRLAILFAIVIAFVVFTLVYFALWIGLDSVFRFWRIWLPLAFITPVIVLALPCMLPPRSPISLRGEAIEVGPDQLPEVHQCAVRFAARLGMDVLPHIFILQNSTINAFAFKFRTRHIVGLHDSLVDACLRSGDRRALEFILGHEMAHHALGHTKLPRLFLPFFYRKLSRLDEFSCDSVANALVGDRDVCARAITMLVVGPQVLPHINLEQLKKQARAVAADRVSVDAESYQTHPLLLRRLSRMI
jgi:Zn-dependent protease with chaperone function